MRRVRVRRGGPALSFSDLETHILERDLCARCGGCVAACPPGVLRLDDEGRPWLAADRAGCGDCNVCLDVCPGAETGVPASEMRLFGRTRTPGERWTGIVRDAVHVTSTDAGVLARASAGGAVTSLLLAALRTRLVEAVLVVGRDPERRWSPRALVTSDEDVVVDSAQSTYCIAPNLQELRDAPYERIGVVALPCETESIGKMLNLPEPPLAARKIAFTIELACASSTRRAGTEHLIEERLGLRLSDVERVKYRDGGYPGEFTVTTVDGRRHALPFFQIVDVFKRFKIYRCQSCPDWWSGVADVSIADGDPNIYATSAEGESARQCSMAIVRTETGARLVDAARAAGLVTVEPAHFDPRDSLGLQRKRFRYARYARAEPERVPTPPVSYEETAPLLGDDEVIEAMSGHRRPLDEEAGSV